MLNAVDLFSGIGGMTVALQGIIKPVAYCDTDHHAVAVLVDNMSRGTLPSAPICPDVRMMSRNWLRQNECLSANERVDAVVAGFPCTGFSNAGKRRGFDDRQSGLFYELVRVVKDLRPRLLFLENVASIHGGGLEKVVDSLHSGLGYNLFWCLLSASDVGAPHIRRRWFCVGVKHRYDIPLRIARAKVTDVWSCEPARTDCSIHALQHSRMKLLGNSVVPQCARHAYLHLLDVSRTTVRAISSQPSLQTTQIWPPNGALVRGSRVSMPIPAPPRHHTRHPINIILSSSSFKTSTSKKNRSTLSPIHGNVTLQYWGTPRVSGTRPSTVLTARTRTDLGTQIRFATDTPSVARGCPTSAQFVEWLMGYPPNWTIAATVPRGTTQ